MEHSIEKTKKTPQSRQSQRVLEVGWGISEHTENIFLNDPENSPSVNKTLVVKKCATHKENQKSKYRMEVSVFPNVCKKPTKRSIRNQQFSLKVSAELI